MTVDLSALAQAIREHSEATVWAAAYACETASFDVSARAHYANKALDAWRLKRDEEEQAELEERAVERAADEETAEEAAEERIRSGL